MRSALRLLLLCVLLLAGMPELRASIPKNRVPGIFSLAADPRPELALQVPELRLDNPLLYGETASGRTFWTAFDPHGLYLDLAIEVVSVSVGVGSAISNFRSGNIGSGFADLGFAALDVGLAVVPGVPGGTGLLRQAGKQALQHGDTVVDAVKGGGKTGDVLAGGNKIADAVPSKVPEKVPAGGGDTPGGPTAKDISDGGGENLVYRGLAKGEDPAKGLTARKPDAGNSEVSHVAGKKESQWISTTKDKATAVEKYGENGVVEIDLNKVNSNVSDVSGGIPNGGRMSNWAKRDKEVLIQNSVPAEAIKKVD